MQQKFNRWQHHATRRGMRCTEVDCQRLFLYIFFSIFFRRPLAMNSSVVLINLELFIVEFDDNVAIISSD